MWFIYAALAPSSANNKATDLVVPASSYPPFPSGYCDNSHQSLKSLLLRQKLLIKLRTLGWLLPLSLCYPMFADHCAMDAACLVITFLRYLYDIAFDNHEYKEYFHEQWSFDKHTAIGEQNHFAIQTCSG